MAIFVVEVVVDTADEEIAEDSVVDEDAAAVEDLEEVIVFFHLSRFFESRNWWCSTTGVEDRSSEV